MDFQHSQPQSVYRSKNYRSYWTLVAIYLFIALISAPRALDNPTFWNIAGSLIWLAVAGQNWWLNQRNRLVMSPAGISVTFGRSAATPWSNVERIQVFMAGSRLRPNPMACLVLREPAKTTLKASTHGIPDELKGRVMSLYPTLWERLSELEQELYGYLRANAADQSQLSVPYNFAAINAHRDLVVVRVIAAVGLSVLIGLFIYIYLTS